MNAPDYEVVITVVKDGVQTQIPTGTMLEPDVLWDIVRDAEDERHREHVFAGSEEARLKCAREIEKDLAHQVKAGAVEFFFNPTPANAACARAWKAGGMAFNRAALEELGRYADDSTATPNGNWDAWLEVYRLRLNARTVLALVYQADLRVA